MDGLVDECKTGCCRRLQRVWLFCLTRETSLTVEVFIDQFSFVRLTEEERKVQIWDALFRLNGTDGIIVKDTAERTIAEVCKLVQHFYLQMSAGV